MNIFQSGRGRETEDEHEIKKSSVRGRETGIHGPTEEDQWGTEAALRTTAAARFQTVTGNTQHYLTLLCAMFTWIFSVRDVTRLFQDRPIKNTLTFLNFFNKSFLGSDFSVEWRVLLKPASLPSSLLVQSFITLFKAIWC